LAKLLAMKPKSPLYEPTERSLKGSQRKPSDNGYDHK
jgi:hypothetical protein